MTTTTLLEQIEQLARLSETHGKEFSIQRSGQGWRVTLGWLRKPSAARWCGPWVTELEYALTDAMSAVHKDEQHRKAL